MKYRCEIKCQTSFGEVEEKGQGDFVLTHG